MRAGLLVLLGIIGGCAGSGGTDGSDTATETDTAGGDTAGETAVACEGMWVRGSLVVPAGVDVPVGAVWVELVRAELVPGDLVEVDVLESTNVGPITAGADTSYALCVPNVPTADDLYSLESFPDMRVVSYSLRAQSNGGVLVGASWPTMLTWLEGTLPASWVDLGAAPGWNILHILRGEGAPFTDASTFDFQANLLWDQAPTLTGVVNPDLSALTSAHIGAYNVNRIVDASLAAPAVSSLTGMAFTATGPSMPYSYELTDPPGDHTGDVAALSFSEAGYYSMLGWEEQSGDDLFQPTSDVLYANSTAGVPRRTLVFIAPKDWRASIDVAEGWPMGWSLLEQDVPVAWSEGMTIGGT